MIIIITMLVPTSIKQSVLAAIDAGNTPGALKGLPGMFAAKTLNRKVARGAVTLAVVYSVIEETSLGGLLAAYTDSEVIEIRDYYSGLHYGQEFAESEFDAEGNETKIIMGSRTYPEHPDHLEIVPDIVEYAGNPPVEVSRVRPTQISYQLSIAGAAQRIG